MHFYKKNLLWRSLKKQLKTMLTHLLGPFDITYSMLQNMGTLAYLFLLDIFNDMWLNSYILNCLKQSKVD